MTIRDNFKTWRATILKDFPDPKIGNGVSRPFPKQRTREYTLLVQIPKCKPMRWSTRAPSLRDAIKYGMNRWPNATVTPIKKP
jgi:hypothetical protein